MKYEEYLNKTSLSKMELIALSWRSLIDDPPKEGIPALPGPPFLMIDRVMEISHNGSKGRIVGEQDVLIDQWYFQCHFRHDPVQPGCLGVDAIWQIIGVYLSIRGARGTGRALGAGEIEFLGQIRPHNGIVKYEVDIRRYVELPDSGAYLAVGNGSVFVDGELIYTIKDAKVGAFKDLSYTDYPHRSTNSIGGQIKR